MPAAVRAVTYVLPARYYVALLQTLFLAGDVWSVILPNAAVLAAMAPRCMLLLARAATRKRARREVDRCSTRCLRILALIRKELLAMFKDPRSRVMLLPAAGAAEPAVRLRGDLRSEQGALRRARPGPQRRLAASFSPIWTARGSSCAWRICAAQRTSTRYIDDRRALARGADPAGFRAAISRPAGRRRCRWSPTAATRTRPARRCATSSAVAQALRRATGGKAHGGARRRRCSVVARAWYNPSLETRWHMIPSLIGTLTMLQTLLLTAMSVAREREEGTFDQLLVTPLRPSEIMIGKAVPSMLVGDRAGDADPAGGAAVVPHPVRRLVRHSLRRACAVPAGRGRHRAHGVVVRRDDAAGHAVLLRAADAVHSALGAHDADRQHAVDAAAHHAASIRLRYAIDMAQRVYLEGADLAQIVPDLWPLAVIAAVTLPTAAWMFRNRLT